MRWGICGVALLGALGCGEDFSSSPGSDAAGGAGGTAGAGGGGARALVINEVDYQNPTLDTMEFVEIVNPGTAPYVLDDIALVLMNGAAGTNREYARFTLSGSLGPGQYMVVSSPTVVVPPGTKTLFFLGPENQIQNAGDAGDAVALFDLAQHQLLDALSYGGSVLGAEIDNEGSFDFVEGTPTPVVDPGDGSIVRVPNGNDTNNAEADWQLGLTPTPGATNTP